MATLAQFSRNIRSQGSLIENSGTAMVKAFSKRALRSLVRGTPADEGVARSNWRVGIGAPTRVAIGAYAPGKNLGISETANANAATNAGIARINSVRGVRGRGLETSIYISNAVPYIKELNNGSSKQAAGGFIEVALKEAQQEIQGFRLFSR